MIEIHHLSTGYARRTLSVHLDATLPPGQLTALLGSNGVGKSTLLRTMVGMLPPREGSVRLCGTSLEHLSPSALSRLVSVVLPNHTEIPPLTVRQLVSLGRHPHTGFFGRLSKEDVVQVDQALEMVGMTVLQHRRLNTLSDGERQKAHIARALAQQTPIILLDEPTTFLDFTSRESMFFLLRRLAHQMQKTILLSTHEVEAALRWADMLWLLRSEGLTIGTPSELRSTLEQLWSLDIE